MASTLAGTRLNVSAEFTDTNGALTDPTAVYLRLKIVSSSNVSNVTKYVYGTDVQIIKDSTGKYHLDGGFLCSIPGYLLIEWGSSATGQESLIQKKVTITSPLF